MNACTGLLGALQHLAGNLSGVSFTEAARMLRVRNTSASGYAAATWPSPGGQP